MPPEQHINRASERNTPIFDALHAAWAGAVLAKDETRQAELARMMQIISTEELEEGYSVVVERDGSIHCEPLLLPHSAYPVDNRTTSEPDYCRPPWF